MCLGEEKKNLKIITPYSQAVFYITVTENELQYRGTSGLWFFGCLFVCMLQRNCLWQSLLRVCVCVRVKLLKFSLISVFD